MRPTIDLTDVMLHTSDKSLERGLSYAESGFVEKLVWRGSELWAVVLGNYPYRVRVVFQDDAITEAHCSCPYDWGGWCKHVVATLHAAKQRGDAIEERPALDELLEVQSAEALADVLRRLVELRPEQVDVVEAWLNGEEPDWEFFDDDEWFE